MCDRTSATSTDTDFIRHSLLDTRDGEIKPKSLLTEWLCRLDTLRAKLSTSSPAEWTQLLEILAIAGRFQRTTAPETDPSVQERLRWADQIIEQTQQSDCEKAIQFLANKNFIEEALRLQEDWVDELDEYQVSVRKAIAVLSDWDDSGIILARLSERFKISNTEIGKARSEFLIWLCTEGDSILLLASHWIQTMAAAFDHDLPDKNLELDVSTQGYIHLLDALEELEKAMNCHPDWIAAKVQELDEFLQPVQRLTVTASNRSLDPAAKINYFTFMGTALSLFVAATVVLTFLFCNIKRDSIADARVSWLATDFEPQPSTARAATNQKSIDETEIRQREYETKIAQSPTDTALLIDYGRFLLKRNRTEEAVTIFEQANRQSPDNPYISLGLGIAAVLQQTDSIALIHFESAIEKSKTDPYAQLYAHLNAASCHHRLSTSHSTPSHSTSSHSTSSHSAAISHHQSALHLIDTPTLTTHLSPPHIEKLREEILQTLHHHSNSQSTIGTMK